MHARLAALILAIGLSSPAAAQDGVFDSYDDLRSTLDGMMIDRRITDFMIAVGAADEMTPQQLDSLEARVREIFPEPLANVTRARAEDLGDGFRHEMLIYWTGTSYLYVRILVHEQADRTVAVTTRFNTDFDAINSLF